MFIDYREDFVAARVGEMASAPALRSSSTEFADGDPAAQMSGLD